MCQDAGHEGKTRSKYRILLPIFHIHHRYFSRLKFEEFKMSFWSQGRALKLKPDGWNHIFWRNSDIFSVDKETWTKPILSYTKLSLSKLKDLKNTFPDCSGALVTLHSLPVRSIFQESKKIPNIVTELHIINCGFNLCPPHYHFLLQVLQLVLLMYNLHTYTGVFVYANQSDCSAQGGISCWGIRLIMNTARLRSIQQV